MMNTWYLKSIERKAKTFQVLKKILSVSVTKMVLKIVGTRINISKTYLKVQEPSCAFCYERYTPANRQPEQGQLKCQSIWLLYGPLFYWNLVKH